MKFERLLSHQFSRLLDDPVPFRRRKLPERRPPLDQLLVPLDEPVNRTPAKDKTVDAVVEDRSQAHEASYPPAAYRLCADAQFLGQLLMGLGSVAQFRDA